LIRLIKIARNRDEKLNLGACGVSNYRSIGNDKSRGFFDMFPFSVDGHKERMVILPLSTTMWFIVISLRLLQKANPVTLGRLYTGAQRAVSFAWTRDQVSSLLRSGVLA